MTTECVKLMFWNKQIPGTKNPVLEQKTHNQNRKSEVGGGK